ncbi:MAG: hypothetical protein ACRDF0_11040 [Candidatus Limnocylindria bacterium]
MRSSWIALALAIAIGLAAAAAALGLRASPAPPPTSFEECVRQGNPVMESYPRQCRAGGRLFVEALPSR